jgi:hypothetical protein
MYNAMNIRIQPYAFDCRSLKHGITKHKVIVSKQFWLLVEKMKFRYFLALKAQRKFIVLKWRFSARKSKELTNLARLFAMLMECTSGVASGIPLFSNISHLT